MDALLQATGVRKEFGGLVAVDDVDFTVPPKSIVSLIGPNGAGKTTFFNMLTGLYKPTAGAVIFDGHNVTGKPPHTITKAGIGRTFQNIRLFPQMTALENVLVGMHSRLKGGIIGSILGTPRVRREEREARDKARELLRFAGLRGVDHELAESLSYGDQRRLEVARALATEPKLLLLDEPTAGMNPQETAEFTDFVARLRTDLDLAVLLIEHDMRVVMGVSDRVTVLDYGEKIAEGIKRDIDMVLDLFPRLKDRLRHHGASLSGGEQQMLAIGRGLMARPKLLLLDEPSMGLAPIFVEKIFEIVKEINEQGTPILLVEQNALMALDVADRGYVLETGHVALEGPAGELRQNEQVRKTYLGEGE